MSKVTVDQLGQLVDLGLPELDRGACVVRGVVPLHLHAEQELRPRGDRAQLQALRDLVPGHLHGDLHQPLLHSVIPDVREQLAILIVGAGGRNHKVPALSASQGNRVLPAESDPADISHGLWRVPASRSAGEQRLRPCRLDGGAAVWCLQAMPRAVSRHRTLRDLAPALQVVSLLLRPAITLGWPTMDLPLEPVPPEGADEEVKEAGEADADDGVEVAGGAVARRGEPVPQQRRRLEARGPEGGRLAGGVPGLEAREVDFGKVAMEVRADDLTARVQPVTMHPVSQLEFPLRLILVGGSCLHQASEHFCPTALFASLQKRNSILRASPEVHVCSCNSLGCILNSSFTTVVLAGDSLLELLESGLPVKNSGVVCHAQSLALRVHAPDPVDLCVEVLLGYGRLSVV
mmetsp:Transcript_96737/g.282811  ORF Transcript_96737/g.282811 Transcript_96737/m.282811 type:complete len:404 (-) Transcript_96737:956-2167(-)